MKLFPEIETFDDEHHSESDNEYEDLFVIHETMAEDAPPYPSEIELVPTDAPSTTTSVGSKKRKGRGPTKSINVTKPMHLEYNALGQPYSKWCRQYGKQIGICMRKICILYAWNEVPEGLKNSLWDDIVVSNFTVFIHLVSF